jgi:hypothetical protein
VSHGAAGTEDYFESVERHRGGYGLGDRVSGQAVVEGVGVGRSGYHILAGSSRVVSDTFGINIIRTMRYEHQFVETLGKGLVRAELDLTIGTAEAG